MYLKNVSIDERSSRHVNHGRYQINQGQLLVIVNQNKKDTKMKANKQAELEKAGWKIGSAKDFLSPKQEGSASIEMKVSLPEKLRKRRQKRGLRHLLL
jgi:hypothetical protein